jgi:hypothetical protein
MMSEIRVWRELSDDGEKILVEVLTEYLAIPSGSVIMFSDTQSLVEWIREEW